MNKIERLREVNKHLNEVLSRLETSIFINQKDKINESETNAVVLPKQ